MQRERVPPWLIAGLVVLVLVIGGLSYYAGRFRRDGKAAPVAAAEFPEPGPPSPDVPESVPTPVDVPPTVTASAPVLIEKTSRASSGVLVERSSEVVVPVGSERIPTARPSPHLIEDAASRNRIVVEVPSPRPSPTPTVPELEQGEEPPPEVTPEPPPSAVPPPPPPTPEPPAFPPTPGVSGGSVRSAYAP